MKIAITGSSGLVGQALFDYFSVKGHYCLRIARPTSNLSGPKVVRWDIDKGFIENEALEKLDAVIHLAGASIAGKRWSKSYKEKILKSRKVGTEQLCAALAMLKDPPSVLFSASAVGYYGSHDGSYTADESSISGNDFLARVCQEWEASTAKAKQLGVRVINMRFGVVLSKKGGALAKMLPAFNLGLGGRLGDGRQIFSWIALNEIPLIIEYLIGHPEIYGPVNFVAPNPVSNSEMTKQIARAVVRPAAFPVPEAMIKLMFGEMGETLLLKGCRVIPKRLLDCGYVFKYASISEALKAALKN